MNTRVIEKRWLALGLKTTRQRRLLLQILQECDDHPDIETLFARARKQDKRISRTTVYRTLRMLEEQGFLLRHEFQDGTVRFEQNKKTHHDHLIDMDSGEILEFCDERIEALQESVARRLGYRLVHHRLELYGRKISASAK